jgi:hypothetical protein
LPETDASPTRLKVLVEAQLRLRVVDCLSIFQEHVDDGPDLSERIFVVGNFIEFELTSPVSFLSAFFGTTLSVERCLIDSSFVVYSGPTFTDLISFDLGSGLNDFF